MERSSKWNVIYPLNCPLIRLGVKYFVEKYLNINTNTMKTQNTNTYNKDVFQIRILLKLLLL